MDALDLLKNTKFLTDGQSLNEILIKALVLIEKDGTWCQQANARDSKGRKVKIANPLAVSWDISGAIGKVSNKWGMVPPFIIKFLDGLVREQFAVNEDIRWLNDHYGHSTILEFMRFAILRSQSIH